MNTQKQFPKGFLWGAATSSYQIEGGLTNDWSEWEKSSERVAELKSKGLEPHDFQSGSSADSWNRMEEDLACLKQINATAYRFSIEWARIEPEEGRFDLKAINRYASFIAKLQESGIEPFVTLWHWPIPLWLRDKGGWANAKIVSYFESYTERLVAAFPTVKFWITMNEPTIFAGNGYFRGIWPPHKKNPFTYLRVLSHLAKAHHAAYKVIKKELPNAQVGIAADIVDFEAAPGFINTWIVAAVNWWWNYYFFNQIADAQDFIGLNFYFHHRVSYGMSKNKNERINDMGWELYPQSIYNVLNDLFSRYQKPIYITENGTADADDDHRGWYIRAVLEEVLHAMGEGVDVRSYLHWSLIDNFEWAHGFDKKFGLFEVDYKTFARRARPSAYEYALIVKNNSL